MFLQLQELQASALRKSIDKAPTPSPEPQALQLTPTTNGELNAKAHSLLCLVHQIVAPSTQAAHAESAAGVTHVPWPKKPLSTHTTVAEDLESLDKDALILKLKQVGVALCRPYKVIWSSMNHANSSGQVQTIESHG